MQKLIKHMRNNRGDANVSKMTLIALVFVVGAICLILVTSAFRSPINNWFRQVTAGWFADNNGKFVSNPYEYQVYYGDINMDGVLDSADADLIVKYCAKWDLGLTDEQIARMDVNGDGEISQMDASRIWQYEAGWDVTIRPAPEQSPYIP